MIDAVDQGVMAREGQMQRLVSYARKNPASARLAGFFQRTGRDSNPRYAFDVHTISNRALSTTQTPAQVVHLTRIGMGCGETIRYCG